MRQVRDLVIKAAAPDGSQEDRLRAFGTLVEMFQDMAFGYAYAILGDFHLAEDAAQTAFITAFRRLEALREAEAFPGWLRRIVQTTCAEITRRKKLPMAPLEEAAGVRSPRDGPAAAAERQEMRRQVLQAIGELPAGEREVTALFYVNGYSQRQVADFLEVPVGTVKNRLHTSRQRLKRRMMKMVSQQLHANKPGPEFSARLFNGINLDKWVILSDGSSYEIQDGELAVTGSLHAEVGGMSWDNYRVGVDVLAERDSSPGKEFPFNVQLCPGGTSVYCQLFGGNVILAYWDEDRQEHFTHLAAVPRPTPLGMWHRFEIQVDGRGVAIFLNGEEVIHKEVPRETRGMLGLVVNCNSDAYLRLRNLQITFLRPTPQQLKELETPAATNWEDYKRRQVAEGKRKSMNDNSL